MWKQMADPAPISLKLACNSRKEPGYEKSVLLCLLLLLLLAAAGCGHREEQERFDDRALAAGKTEYDLRSAALVIEPNDASTQVSSPTITFSGTGTTRTATVNLLNKSY